jgi:AbiU2
MNDPAEVKRVTVATAELPMIVPPFIDQHGNTEDKALANELLRVTRETRVLLGQFFLYTAMSRSKAFADACNASDAKEGAAIVVGSLLRSMVVSTAALFDEDQRTSSIPKVLRKALAPKQSAFLKKFHKHYDVEAVAHSSRERLVKYGRALNRGKLRAAIQALIGVRNTFVGHFDMQPIEASSRRKAIIHDFDHVISAASIVVGEANIFILGRKIEIGQLRSLLRREADGLTTTLLRGFRATD